MFTVDYTRRQGDNNNAFIAELSFATLDWMILDKSRKFENFTIKDIDHE